METVAEKTNLLVSAAKLVGAAVGTIASLGGTAPRIRVVADGKLPKKHKHRLPRLQKKALKAKEERAAPQA
jgi:hypothetical protein